MQDLMLIIVATFNVPFNHAEKIFSTFLPQNTTSYKTKINIKMGQEIMGYFVQKITPIVTNQNN